MRLRYFLFLAIPISFACYGQKKSPLPEPDLEEIAGLELPEIKAEDRKIVLARGERDSAWRFFPIGGVRLASLAESNPKAFYGFSIDHVRANPGRQLGIEVARSTESTGEIGGAQFTLNNTDLSVMVGYRVMYSGLAGLGLGLAAGISNIEYLSASDFGGEARRNGSVFHVGPYLEYSRALGNFVVVGLRTKNIYFAATGQQPSFTAVYIGAVLGIIL